MVFCVHAYAILKIMNQGGPRQAADGGFTIVETLIVLAVTTVLFISAAAFISGRQARTEFAVGIRQVRQQIEQVINETSSGYYPNAGNIKCELSPLRPLKITNVGGTSQGTNGDCIFIGKTVVAGALSGKPKDLTVYSIAGRRLDTTGAEVTNLLSAWPTALSPGSTNAHNLGAPDTSNLVKLPAGIELVSSQTKRVAMPMSAPDSSSAFAFSVMSSLADFTTGAGPARGTQNFYLYGFSAWNPALPAVNNINSEPLWTYKLETVKLCFASDGGVDQSGLVTIGGTGSGLNVTLELKTGLVCA
jgi:type II secretory pathway pseudopilin PulG